MDKDHLSKQSGFRTGKKGGRIVPVLCNIVGVLILLSVIAAAQISTLPKFYGLDAYNMTVSNMEPTIPVGSVVYVRRTAQQDLPLLVPDDLIACLTEGEGVEFYRVVENHPDQGEFLIKSDFYEKTEEEPLLYEKVFGRVERHYAVLGDIMAITRTTAGKINLAVFAICGILLNILAGRLRRSREED